MTIKIDMIQLNDTYQMKIMHPSEFSVILDEHFGKKYYQNFFRNASAWQEKCNYLQECFIIYNQESAVGGVILKNNLVTCLFTIPPYYKEAFLTKLLVDYLKKQSVEVILIEEMPKVCEDIYLELGFEETFSEVYMIRETEQREAKLDDGYYARAIEKSDVKIMASVIREAYLKNPCYRIVDSLESYENHVSYFLESTKRSGNLYESSRLILEKKSQDVVGMCLHCEDTDMAYIMSLIVKPGYQGQGIGSYMLDHSINVSHDEFKMSRLSVISDNRAIGLYERHGFRSGEPVVNYQLKLRS